MPSQGPKFPAVVEIDTADRTHLLWDDPQLVKLDDNIVATCQQSPATYRLTVAINARDFGFTIPPGSVIQGIEFIFEGMTSLTLGGQCRDGTATLLMNGVVVGQISSSNVDWTPGMHPRTIGGPANLWGWAGATWQQINDPGFTVRFDVQVASGNTCSIDYFSMRVTYAPTTYQEMVGSGGIGLGGQAPTKSIVVSAGRGGIGFGGQAKVMAAPAPSGGGIGFGGQAPVLHFRSQTGEGGIGLGAAAPMQQIFAYNGSGGIGLGGDAIVNRTAVLDASGGMGFGGQALVMPIPAATGGIGLGGQADYHKERSVVPEGGIGLGGEAYQIVRTRSVVPEGGIGLGGYAIVNRFNAHSLPHGGIGLGGSAKIHRYNVNGGGTDPEDDIERSHRGPVTRRMVFQAILEELVAGPLSRQRAYISDDEPDMNNVPPGDMFAVIIPGIADNNQGDMEGGGKVATMRTDSCEVRVYSAMSLDQVARTTAFNLRVDRGAMERARQIRLTLNLDDLVDGAGWLLLSEPMRATRTGTSKPTRVTPKWQYYGETFEIKFTEYLG